MPGRPTITVYDAGGEVVRRFDTSAFTEPVWVDLAFLPGDGMLVAFPHRWTSRGLGGQPFLPADDDPRTVWLLDVATGGYDVDLPPGEYDIELRLARPPGVSGPDLATRLRDRLRLTQSGNLDLATRLVTISGLVTINGTTMPANSANNGYRADLRFRDRRTLTHVDFPFEGSGPASYEVLIFEGDYDIELRPDPEHRQDALPAYPLRLLTACD
jgi:hypothetical protein